MSKKFLGLVLLASTSLLSTQSFADAKAGEAVVKASDCLLCHQVDKAVVGPAFKDVAAKYKGADSATIAKLAEKVKTGGSGVWGKTPMAPHPALSDADRINAVEWVLSQK